MSTRRCIFCAKPAIPPSSRCEKHQTEAQRRYRSRSWRPRPDLHTNAWTELSRRIRAERPVCELPGCSRPSASVDHVVPNYLGGSDELSNLRALCAEHHQRKSASEGGRARARKRRS